ncbi:MAG: hypothetical protein H7X99_05065, partial [Saprospiraceae bacterium]|nr:hypothetical protein [Saprospiraceae bacterium]
MNIRIFFPILLLVIITACSKKEKNVISDEIIAPPFILKPIKNVDVPFETFKVEAEKGKKLEVQSGSYIIFPPDAFVDADGNMIKGNVDIFFREFQDPFDFFVAGIPMQYDTLGSTYTFESSAMCEINALYNNSEVFINPNNRPSIHLISKNDDEKHNLYFMDTIKRLWIPIGKSKIENKVTNLPVSSKLNNAQKNISSEDELKEPIKANPQRPIITVSIPYVDFLPELKIFKNTKFEVDQSETKYNPKDGDLEWDKVKLQETDSEGLYNLIFTSGQRKVSYKVRPVYEGDDYTAAMKIYMNKRKEKEIEENRLKSIITTNRNLNKIYRTFSILEFGIYNCDQIIENGINEILADYIDQDGNKIKVTNSALVNLNKNALFEFIGSSLKVFPNDKQGILSYNSEGLYFFTTSDFKNSQINADTKSYTFKMRK